MYPARGDVPDDKCKWSEEFKEYNPVQHTARNVLENDRDKVKPEDKPRKGWADPDLPMDELAVESQPFGEAFLQELKARKSFEARSHSMSDLKYDHFGRPLNPRGRTGMAGRGLLGKWGPNHAADPIVTRINPYTQRLQMVAVQRRDTKEWAIPGGMVDAGETVSQTIKREFMEEATSTERFSKLELLRNKQLLDELFAKEQVVYRGYVDDPRNTDHAWMETSAFHFHCNAECAKMLKLEAGDDAAAVRWIDIDDPDVLAGLYASHRDWVDMCAQKLQPHTHCRTDSQLYNYPKRFVVEDEQVPWEVPLPGYDEQRPEITQAGRVPRRSELTRGDSRAFNLLGRRQRQRSG